MADVKELLKARKAMEKEIDELEAKRDKLKMEVASTRNAILPREEIIDAIMQSLTHHRAKYLQRVGFRLSGMSDPNAARHLKYAARQTSWFSLDSASGKPSTEGLLGLLGDSLAPALKQALEEAPYPDDRAGLPSGKREERIAALSKEINACDEQIRGLLQQAAEAGIEFS